MCGVRTCGVCVKDIAPQRWVSLNRYFGKWHLGGRDARPFGFDTSVIWGRTNNHRHCNYSVDGGKPVAWTGYSNAAGTTDQALKWLDEHGNRPAPFFLMISLNPPHGPMLDAPEDKKALYPDEAALPFHPHDEIRNFRDHQGYHAHVSVVDDQVGRIAAKLDQLGVTENTVFIYTSDHGGMSGVHGIAYGQKRNPEDESSRVPFLIQWPGTIAGSRRTDTLFSTIDIFPTLCSLANLHDHLTTRIRSAAAPDSEKATAREAQQYIRECPGVDLAPNLLGQAGAPDPDSVFLMHVSNMNNTGSLPQPIFRGIVTRDYLYAVHPDGEYCLYAHTEAYQHHSLVNDPAMRAVKHELRQHLGEWLRTAEEPFLDAWFQRTPGHWQKNWYGPERGNGGNRAAGVRGTFDLRRALELSGM